MKTPVEAFETEIEKIKAILNFLKRKKFLIPLIFIEIIAFILVNYYESQLFAVDSTSPDWLKIVSLLVMSIAFAGIVYIAYRLFVICFKFILVCKIQSKYKKQAKLSCCTNQRAHT